MNNKSNQRMRAVAIDEFGGIEKMKPRELPVPEVATDEILVRAIERFTIGLMAAGSVSGLQTAAS